MNPKRILIIKLSAIGDVVHALPVAAALKKNFPEAHITWIVEGAASDLLKDNPCIDRVLIFEKAKFRSVKGFLTSIVPFSKMLKLGKYDLSIDLQGLFKSAVIAWLAGAVVKLGWTNMREGSQYISQRICGAYAKGHIVDRYMDSVRYLTSKKENVNFPFFISDKDKDSATKIFQQAGGRLSNPYIVLAIGANWPNKRWPSAKLAALSDWLYEKNRVPVLIGGGIVDEMIVEDICAISKIPPVNLVGKTTLKQLAFIMQNAQGVLGGDTGTVHLAAALQIKVIMLMGPTDAPRNGPYGQLENVIQAEHSCKYCWQRQCQYQKDCLDFISLEQVTEKMERLFL